MTDHEESSSSSESDGPHAGPVSLGNDIDMDSDEEVRNLHSLDQFYII